MNTKMQQKLIQSYENTTPTEEEERQSTHMDGEMPLRMTIDKHTYNNMHKLQPASHHHKDGKFYYLPTEEEEEEDQISSVS